MAFYSSTNGLGFSFDLSASPLATVASGAASALQTGANLSQDAASALEKAKTTVNLNMPSLPSLPSGGGSGLSWPSMPNLSLPSLPNLSLPNVSLPNVSLPGVSLPGLPSVPNVKVSPFRPALKMAAQSAMQPAPAAPPAQVRAAAMPTEEEPSMMRKAFPWLLAALVLGGVGYAVHRKMKK
jgi:hypothetical protein